MIRMTAAGSLLVDQVHHHRYDEDDYDDGGYDETDPSVTLILMAE